MTGFQINRDRILRGRGASAIGYGLIVGLISVAALAAITTTGSSVQQVFNDSSSSLGNVVEGTAGSAAAPATPAPSVEPPCLGMELVATSPRSGGGTWGLCRFDRTDPAQVADADSVGEGCRPTSSFSTTQFDGVSGGHFNGLTLGAVRYETVPVSDAITSGSASHSGSTYDCVQSTCTSRTVGGGLSAGGNAGRVSGMSFCEISLDNFNMTGLNWGNQTSLLITLEGAHLGGVQSFTHTGFSVPIQRYRTGRELNSANMNTNNFTPSFGQVLIRVD
ncbi:MAG: hypothetical protein Alpg2KO_32260 [Alphaproteobacteria bacterium]